MRNFWKNEDGNTAMIFSVSLIGVLAAVGMAMDYGGVRSGQTTLQAQVDAAVLALGKSGAETEQERRDIIMGSLLENGYVPGSYVPQFEVTSDGAIRVWASADYTPMVMGLFGKSTVKINAEAESRIAKEAAVEIVMVLDTTGSMSGNKLTSLKDAATGLVNSIAIYDDAEVKIGMVPFSNYVNVGTDPAIRNASWMDVPPDESYTEDYEYQPTRQTSAGTPQTCSGTETYTHSGYNDGVAFSEDRTRSTGCTGGSPATYENDGPVEMRTRTITNTWHGCVGSRLDPLHTRDSDYASRIPGLMNVYCANPLVPLTVNYGDMRNKITALSASQSTYMPAGVMWGQRVLSSQIPYDEGAMVGTNERKIMIVMTDGMNTMYLDGNQHTSSSPSDPAHNGRMVDTNKDTEDACDAAKAAGTEIFTIAFEVPDVPTKKMLERCATDADHYYDAANSQELIGVFRNIAARIINVRLTK